MTLDLTTLHLDKGGHDGPEQGACLLEAVAMFAGERFGDTPACVSPVLGEFGRSLNDVLDDTKRQQLKPFIPRLPGTAGDGLDETRGYLALDWLVRTYLPTWLRLVPELTAQADLLAQYAPIVDLETAAHIGDIVRAVASQAYVARATTGATTGAAAGAAAWDAAWAVAGDAAWDAAWGPATDAARGVWDVWDAWDDTAWGAARDAAWAVAGDAVGDAARALLAPTVEALQDSAVDLFDRMITADGVR